MSIMYTFSTIIVPILIPIGLGVLLNLKFNFDLAGFSKLNLYYYVPALAFIKLYEAQLSAKLVVSIFGFLILQFIAMAVIGALLTRILKLSKPMASSFANSILLTNNGNIGIPVNSLVFKQDPMAMSIQIMVVIFELLVTFTFGLLNASQATHGLKKSLMQFAKMPVLYAIIFGCLFHLFNIPLAEPIRISISNIAAGMLSFALVTIGSQISSAKVQRNTLIVLLSSFVRLILSPACAYLLICLLGLQGMMAQALFIASAIPSSRNSAALALEYNNEPEFAAQAVLVSTLLSSVTLTIVIDFAYALF